MKHVIHHLGGRGGERTVLVHGGAGNVAPERRPLHAAGCLRAAREGARVLAAGGTALDAVERAVRVLEDDPLFNAGTGACLNEEGHVELDASIMEGRALRAGAVCALANFAEPIAIARAALEDGRHVLYAAHGAARFARQKGFSPVDEAALITEAARAALAAAQQGRGSAGSWAGSTVGAVARDASGLSAAATSTGGTVNKRVGRVGDSPIIGAGTYADDEAGAVSTTGYGEGMIRLAVAHSAVEHMRAGSEAAEAARAIIAHLAERLDVTGGLIAIDRGGRFGLARSTATMSWAAAGDWGEESGV
ncbi:asparaginase [Sorangium cellulosum]|uniref:Isoaspartyl peptidase n=1 Tax=Sorangium cellulosum TaxID=56 RepID=A0A2L0ERX3_SORCE|nr:isoaspartyl peptidase/L-asparaginase [Sorangium cellulosum]AUX42051.1 asparaginase [Sorangium cellulosum]